MRLVEHLPGAMLEEMGDSMQGAGGPPKPKAVDPATGLPRDRPAVCG